MFDSKSCDCLPITDPRALIITHLPEGWQKLPESIVALQSWVECANCHAVLKPAGVHRATAQAMRDSGYSWCTVRPS